MTDRETLYNNLNSYFMGYWMEKDIDINQQAISTNQFNASMMYIYDLYICKLETIDLKGIKKYSYIDFINLVNWYIYKSLELNKISLYGFALLINRSMQFLYNLRDCDFNDICNSFIIDIVDNKNVSNIDDNIIIEVSVNRDSEKASLLLKDSIKKLFESIQQQTVNKLNDTTIGLVTNANNNKDIGLMYAKERIQETAKARAVLSLSDLPLLE